MKKILFIALIFLLKSQIIFGQQTWAQPGATWYYGIGDNSSWGSSGYVEIKKIGDTLFNGINCDVLTFHFDYIQNWTGGTYQNYYSTNRYTYISNDTVYLNYGTTFETMFLTSPSPGSYWVTGPDETGNCAGDTIEVDSLQVVTINGYTMNRIVPVPADLWPPNMDDRPTIIYNAPLYERFGSTGYFFPIPICISDFAAGPLCYYTDSSGFVFSNLVSPFCDNVPTGLTTINNENKPSIFPTITNGNLNLSLPFVKSGETTLIEIVDINGRLVYKNSVDKMLIELNVSYLKEGIYICKIIRDNRNINLKFIKSNR